MVGCSVKVDYVVINNAYFIGNYIFNSVKMRFLFIIRRAVSAHYSFMVAEKASRITMTIKIAF